MSLITATRYHDFCAGHRVHGHENKCAHLHGHNYRATFHCRAEALDDLGRVIDFSVIKAKLCEWLEDNWDHKFLHWEEDPVIEAVKTAFASAGEFTDEENIFTTSLVACSFNPTAENMAQHLVDVVGPTQLAGTGVQLVKVDLSETRKCSASYEVSK